jgi:hypothetical protein
MGGEGCSTIFKTSPSTAVIEPTLHFVFQQDLCYAWGQQGND